MSCKPPFFTSTCLLSKVASQILLSLNKTSVFPCPHSFQPHVSILYLHSGPLYGTILKGFWKPCVIPTVVLLCPVPLVYKSRSDEGQSCAHAGLTSAQQCKHIEISNKTLNGLWICQFSTALTPALNFSVSCHQCQFWAVVADVILN